MYHEDKNTVLDQAIRAVNGQAGMRLYIIDREEAYKDEGRKLRIDALIGIKGYEPLQFAAEVKKWAQHANFGAIVHQLKKLPMKGLLVADYINPEMADRLKEEDVQFIDTAGNAYINAEPLFIYIKGNRIKLKDTKRTEEKRRAFTRTGLKVIYALLCDPRLVREAYRNIAEKADVALGTVGWIIRDLKEMKYLIDHGDKETRKLNNYFELLDKWAEMYPAVLRPRQFIGEFNKDVTADTKQVNLEKYDAYWGGEAAGTYYTNYLKAEVDTIYVPDNKKNALIHDLKLFRGGDNKYGKVKLYQPFWKKPENYTHYVHPVLAYADLIATGDVRNIETARLIMDEHIKPERQD